jgi:hypothetical protein
MLEAVSWKLMTALGAATALGVGGLGVYAEHERQLASQLAAQNQEVSFQLAGTRQDVQRLTSTVNTLMARVDAQPAPAPAPVPGGSARKPAGHKTREDNPPLKSLQAQVDEQGLAIDETRNQLAGTQEQLNSTRTELTGSIARTHDELVMLQRKDERNYYEFDISKSKQFSFQGPVGIRLKKANTKHNYANLELMLDDRSLTQKHVNIYQPLMFSRPDSPQPMEIVINNISKDHIHGYIRSAKYRQSELAATKGGNTSDSSSGGPATSANSGTAQTRQKLPSPQ